MKKHNSFTIYDASAGSGKTYTLVKEYLKLLLTGSGNEGYRNILAITFTNKAVAEMKSRILEGLKGLCQKQKNKKELDLLQQLSNETGLSSIEIEEKSFFILRNILHDYASFEVSTIDGFTHRVLRTFAKDLGLPVNFEVQLRTEEVLTEAVDRVIGKAGEEKMLTQVLINFVLAKTDDDKSWDVSRDLFEIARLITNEADRPFLNLLKNKSLEDFQGLSQNVRKQMNDLKKGLADVADNFFDLLHDNDLENTDFTRQSCPNFFKKLQKQDLNIPLDLKWQNDLEDQPMYNKNQEPSRKERMDQLQPRIFELFSSAKKGILAYQFLEAVEKNLVPLSLLSSIQNEIEEIKKENSIVLISEFNATIGKTVKDQPAPFVYERLGEKYRHYFIDEFQDTSQLQWENLIPLVAHSLETDHSAPDFGSLTLVGDAKQSIYRWRGGKAEQFMELCAEKNPFSLRSKEDKKLFVLPRNFRSAKTIVNFNNDFFNFSSSCFQLEKHRTLFQKSSQQPVSEREGYVNISFIEAETAAEELEVYPQRVLEIIRKLENEGIQKSGICILTRRRKESIAVANYLSENAVPVISAESLLLSRSPEVCLVNSVLQFCLEPTNKSLKFEILDYLLNKETQNNIDFKELQYSLEEDGQKFFESLKKFSVYVELNSIHAVSVYEAVEYIIRNFSLVKNSNAYLQFYLDFVYETSHSEGLGIFSFLELWDRKKDELSIVVPQGENAVQIMTIHKAKGLEFPVVIYPFADSPISDTSREAFWMNLPESLSGTISVAYLKSSEKMKMWDGEAPALYDELYCNSQLDALNVFYVALTRPVQQLYVISKYNFNSKGEENPNKFSGLLISYLKHIGEWNEAKEYELGNFEELPVKIEAEVISHSQENFFSSPTQGKGISIVTKAGALWDSQQKEAIEKGKLIHDLFARINTHEDLVPVLKRSVENGLFGREEEKELEKTLHEVINHPELKGYFETGIENFNERDIVSGSGEILRPDRINFLGSKAVLIDYKTGAENQKHKDQINSYADILTEMNFSVEKKLLVYINEGVSIINV